jgi:ubiquitin conjugation factor E4 B
MISDLVNIYINVAEFDDICKEICQDERSYSDDLLIDLGKTANKHNLVTPQKLNQMENMINKLIEIQNSNQVMKKLLEDLPEQYTCSLTYEMMMDPVKLPNSGSIVDRKSIKQHIMLNGQTDPFSRQTLKLEDCIELPAFKKEISEWYNAKIAQFNLPMKAKVQINTGAEMDEEDHVFARDQVDEENPDLPFFDRFGGQ